MKHGGKQEEFNKESQWDNMWRGKIPKAYPKNEHKKYTHSPKRKKRTATFPKGGEGSAKPKEEACTRYILKVATLKWPMN